MFFLFIFHSSPIMLSSVPSGRRFGAGVGRQGRRKSRGETGNEQKEKEEEEKEQEECWREAAGNSKNVG